MFGSYLQGAIGLVVGIAGSILGFICLAIVILDNRPDPEVYVWMFIGFGLAIGGGYMRYLSNQTVRVGDSKLESDQSNDSLSNNSFNGEKSLDNDSYQLFLVKKFNIEKNDVLNKFVLNNKTYASLEEALKIAKDLDN